MFGADDGDSLRQLGMIPSPIQYTPVPQAAPQQQQPAATTATTTNPQAQWSQEETRELIRIRADLERDFTASKRNKTLWEAVSARMRERGYRRTPDQCKCKWKNLLNRYKGTETSDPENSKQCPFFEELHVVFSERAHNMQRLHLESDKASSHSRKKAKKVSTDVLIDEASDDEDEEETDEERPVREISRKRKADISGGEKPSKPICRAQHGGDGVRGDVFELLKEFFEQQQRMEMQWREMMERRAQERMLFEQEWRHMMEKLERERLMVEQSWREREEQRRLREESRAERRDALLTTLLDKILQEHNL